MFSGSPNPMDLLPTLTDNNKYLGMETGLFQTGSSYNNSAERLFCEIPTLKTMFSGSPNPMDLFPMLTDNGEYPEMEIGLFQTGSSYNYAA